MNSGNSYVTSSTLLGQIKPSVYVLNNFCSIQESQIKTRKQYKFIYIYIVKQKKYAYEYGWKLIPRGKIYEKS